MTEAIRLVDSGWVREVEDAVRIDAAELRVISPFVKLAALERLLARRAKSVRVITRFNLADFAGGVSDISALRRLLQYGARVRGIRNLHAKVYLFGSARAIVTSANLTESALKRNHEFGLVAEDAAVVATCRRYFDDLWSRAHDDLTMRQLDEWDSRIAEHLVAGWRPNLAVGLGDYGVDAGIPPAGATLPTAIADGGQAFVKFLGRSGNRVPWAWPVFDELERSGCHWALGYPRAQRPRAVKDNAVMFIARLTRDPNDIVVFGRGLGLRHVPGRDDATAEDIELHAWKADWPRYIQVHQTEFVAGTMANGVPLNILMRELGANSFASTKANAERGAGNTDPRNAYRRKPAVELSAEGMSWLAERLQSAFDRHGTVPQDTLDSLPRPPAR